MNGTRPSLLKPASDSELIKMMYYNQKLKILTWDDNISNLVCRLTESAMRMVIKFILYTIRYTHITR